MNQKTRIYKLENDDGEYYIGSTKKPLSIRLSEHRSSYKTNTTFKSSSSKLFENGKGVKIELIEEFDDEENIKLKENKYIKEHWGKCVNKRCSVFDRDFYNERRRKKYLLKKISL
jgi:predicted GIY-YIG superfamily endonuclease